MYLNNFFADDANVMGFIRCKKMEEISFDIKIAFQPIVNCETGEIYAYEALVRGANGESAHDVIASHTPEKLYRFDQTCRVLAIDTATKLGINTKLSINFMPNAVFEPSSCIQITLAAAKKCQLPFGQIILELSETEKVIDFKHLENIISSYKNEQFSMAIDDFGSGYSGLNLLVNFKPNIIKLDMELVRNINNDPVRMAVAEGIIKTCYLLSILVIAEGVETIDEYNTLRELGVTHFQGYMFARPEIERLPLVNLLAILNNSG